MYNVAKCKSQIQRKMAILFVHIPQVLCSCMLTLGKFKNQKCMKDFLNVVIKFYTIWEVVQSYVRKKDAEREDP